MSDKKAQKERVVFTHADGDDPSCPECGHVLWLTLDEEGDLSGPVITQEMAMRCFSCDFSRSLTLPQKSLDDD